MHIPILLNEKFLEIGCREYIGIDLTKACHIAVAGVTGSGKSYFIKLMLAKFGKYLPNSKLYIADFKGGNDFNFLSGSERYARFDKSLELFDKFYFEFVEAQKNTTQTFSPHIFLFEEWGAALSYLSKKEAEEYKKRMGYILMMGRSFSFHLVTSQQRLSAEYYPSVRDNFGAVVNLGTMSREVQSMIFADFKDEIQSDKRRGTGYMLVNGCDLYSIVVPHIRNMNAVDKMIYDAINR